ncbi:16S rRNA (uracil(1498)-N(3))-methyltransferase [Candidatus Formimonas warabiya]|uniref:Ribosomal RNA small subunit methyltransferase E n=1 Tax=Formimonas warabiya TaxID=1761012 RepID=A0A3G1KSB5_FORW1|nr:16S rRNA (uracil(1498)-N(3))-methyltransferase [Candidatus Formimonas warabiya]ATW25351.1 hypothetical protein DCMF_11745 [Candidatus Formimonas warabiya]
MTRFFVPADQIRPPLITILGSDVHHIGKVLRLKPGDTVLIADGTGREYLAELTEITAQKVTARIQDHFLSHHEPPLDVYLLQGLPKGDKLEFIIQKCTEVGVRKIIPIHMERTIVRLPAEKARERRERWQRIAAEAAKQCQRGVVPEIEPVCGLEQVLQELPKETLLVMPWEEEKNTGLKDILKQESGASGPVAVLIGPEGGISPQEAEVACTYGAKKATLGPRILRTETAGLVTLSLILYELGDLGGKSIG